MSLHARPRPDGPDRHVVLVPDGWGQGRAVFGGLTVAYAVRALEDGVAPGRRIRSVSATFFSPAVVGELQIVRVATRVGRAATLAEVHVRQDGELRLSVSAVFGEDRATAIAVPPLVPPPLGAPGPVLPYIPDVTPEFTRHFAYRFHAGGLPFSGADVAAFAGEIQARKAGPVDAGVLLALLDAWPAPALSLLRAPAPASTVSWLVGFVEPPTGDAADTWRYEAGTPAAGEGYATVEAALRRADGALVAWSRQVQVEFSVP